MNNVEEKKPIDGAEYITLEDAKRVRREQNLDNRDNKAMKMIRTWINRSYVIQDTEYSFRKVVSRS